MKLGIILCLSVPVSLFIYVWLSEYFGEPDKPDKPKEKKWQRWHEHDNHLAEGIGDPYCILCFNKDGTGACQKNAFPNDN